QTPEVVDDVCEGDRGEECRVEPDPGDAEPTHVYESLQYPGVDLLRYHVVVHLVLFNDLQPHQFLQVVEGYARAGESEFPLHLPYPDRSSLLEHVQIDLERLPPKLILYFFHVCHGLAVS